MFKPEALATLKARAADSARKTTASTFVALIAHLRKRIQIARLSCQISFVLGNDVVAFANLSRSHPSELLHWHARLHLRQCANITERKFPECLPQTSVYTSQQRSLPFSFMLLRHGGHGHLCSRAHGIFALPQAGNGLLLCVELEAWSAIECVCTSACHGLLVSSEAEHGERHWDRCVDTHLTSFNLLLKSTRRGS